MRSRISKVRLSRGPKRQDRPGTPAAPGSPSGDAAADQPSDGGGRRGSPRGRLFRRYLIVLVGLVGGALLVSSLVGLYFINRDTRRAASRLLQEKVKQASVRPEAALDVVDGILERLRPGLGPEAHPVTLAERRAAFHRALRPRREPGSGELVASVPAFSYSYLDAADRE